jgi:CheY-like chemotaxis protein
MASEAYLKAAQRVTRKAHRNTELVARRASKPRIIVMTAYETEEDIRQPLKVGAKAFLVKGSQQREAIVRAFIGEARFLPESMRRALEEFMLTGKTRLVAALQEAQKRGLVRMDVDLSAAADFIRDSIHSAMLRHTLYRTDPEAVDAHLRGVTDIFYRGIKANH